MAARNNGDNIDLAPSELGTNHPSGSARTLIEVIKAELKAVRCALAKSA